MKQQSFKDSGCYIVSIKEAIKPLLLSLLLAAPTVSPAVSSIDVHGGSLDVGSTLEAGEITVGSGATLGGSGTLIGDLTVEGAIEPAVSSPGPVSLLVQGDAVFEPGSTFLCYAAAHNQSDLLNVQGLVSGSCTVVPDRAVGAVPVDQTVIAALNGFYDNFSLLPADTVNWHLQSNVGGNLLLTHLTGDTDLNGLPDWFELQYFTDRTGADPADDGDSDRLTNEEEWIAGTDPTDGSSVFKIIELTPLGGSSNLVEWTSVSGRQYSLYYGSNVASRTTALIEDEPATPPVNSVIVDSTLDQLFIHAEVERITGP